jgi:hypothetical protein
MGPGTVLLSAFGAALWLQGFATQLHSGEAAMRYLALTLAVLAVAVWRRQPRPVRRRFRDRRRPPGL